MRRKIEIAPSILSADFARLADEIAKVEQAGADVLHLDVMDGHFVPNLTFGPPVVSWIRKSTSMPLDAHLMVEEPSRYIDGMARAGVNRLSVHAEADHHLHRTLQAIREQGIRAGVALNPATPLAAIEDALEQVDFVLVMSVNPGFGGQSFIPAALKKIRKLRALLTSYNRDLRIQVDGGVGPDNLRDVIAAGADIIVVGSAVFAAKVPAGRAVQELRDIAGACLQSDGGSRQAAHV